MLILAEELLPMAGGRRRRSVSLALLQQFFLPRSSSPDLLPMRTCFMSPSQLSPSAYIVDGSTEYREILYACNPSWRCSHIHLRPRLHSSSSPYGPDHFTIQYYYGPGFFFSIFLLAPLPFHLLQSTSPLFATGIIDLDRGIHSE